MQNNFILIRGAGDLASAVALRLYRAGYKIVMTEIPFPTMVRRTVAFAEAVYSKQHCVEGVYAILSDLEHYQKILSKNAIPILLNIKQAELDILKPLAVIDAIIAKKNLGTYKNNHYYCIGLGPGFHAPEDVDVVIETNRGHQLGRCIYSGTAQKNTGIPGNVAGYTIERVLYASVNGHIQHKKNIGDVVHKGDCISLITNEKGETQVLAQMNGMLRGLIHPQCPITKGLKIADIDARINNNSYITVSDKGSALGGAVLEALLHKEIFPN